MKILLYLIITLLLLPIAASAKGGGANDAFAAGYREYSRGDFSGAAGYFSASENPLIVDYAAYFLAMSCLKSGDAGCAGENFRKVIKEHPSSGLKAYAERNIRRLSGENGLRFANPADELSRLEKLYVGRDDAKSVQILADAYFEGHEYARAKDLYRRLVENRSDAAFVSNMVRLAQSSARSDDIDSAIEIYKELLEKYPNTDRRTYIYKLGFLYMDSNRYAPAIENFQALADSNGRLPARINWLIGWCHYKLGNLDDAIGYFEKVGDGGRAMYWIARSYEKKGEKARARNIYDSLAGDRYYGRLSTKRALGRKAPQQAPGGGESVLPASPDKVKYFESIGFPELAAYEYRGRACEDCYPRAYHGAVSKSSKEFGVDDDLVYSVIRQESRFENDVISGADAIGLMQIIPKTAFRLAGELGKNGFEVEDLFDPLTNIRFGVKYLGDLAKKFNGESVYTLAAYNAGEEAVSRWVKGSDASDIEEFIEEIPYGETRDYVKKVLANYWIYKAGD